MRKWIALLLCLCLLLPCAALGETSAETPAPEDESDEAVQTLTLYDVRYYFEHRLLPEELYENRDQLVAFLRSSGVHALWASLTGSIGFETVYPEDAFGIAEFPQEDGTNVIMLSLPAPEDSPLCSRVYLCWNPETGKAGYYTVELDNLFGETWFLCGWNAEGIHENYGTVSALPAPDDPDYDAALQAEAAVVTELLNGGVRPEGSFDPSSGEAATGN